MTASAWAMALLATTLTAPLVNATDRIETYAAVAPLTLQSSEGLQRLELPLAVLQASLRPGYADVRLFDAQGAPVPLAWAQQPPLIVGTERRVVVPAFAWPTTTSTAPTETSVHVQMDANGAVVRLHSPRATPESSEPTVWLLDLSRLDPRSGRITRLTLDWPARPGGVATGVRIEGSDDTRHWHPVAQSSLLDLAQSGAPTLRHVDWPALSAPRYVRLHLDAPLALSRAEVTLSQAPAALPLTSQRVTFTAAHTTGNEPRPWEVDLQGRVPVSRLRVHLPQTNTVVPLRLQQRDDPRRPWRTVASLVAWRLTRNGQDLQAPAVAVEASSARYWQLVPDARSAGWSPPTLEATVEWNAPQIVFAIRGLGSATPPPAGPILRLAVGRDGHDLPPLSLAALMPGYEPGAEYKLPSARVAALTLQTVTPAALQERLREASPAERQRWTLWLALVLAVIGLGVMAWKLVREVKTGR